MGRVVNVTISRAPITFVEIQGPEFDGYISHAPRKTPELLPLVGGGYLYLYHRLCLRRKQRYLTTLEYSYVYQATKDEDSQLVRYSYKREPGDDYPYPPAHVHVNAQPGSYTGTKSFKDLHLPTGRVTVEGVARHLVTEHGIGPISDDWEAILSETEDAFRQIQRKRFRD